MRIGFIGLDRLGANPVRRRDHDGGEIIADHRVTAHDGGVAGLLAARCAALRDHAARTKWRWHRGL